MEIAFFVIGMLFIVTGLRNNAGQFWSLLENDLVGPGGFLIWAGLLTVIFVGGEVMNLKTPARLLMFLLLFVYAVKNPTAISGLSTGVSGTKAPAAVSSVASGTPTQVTGPTATPSTGGGGETPSRPSGGATPSSSGGGASPFATLLGIH